MAWSRGIRLNRFFFAAFDDKVSCLNSAYIADAVCFSDFISVRYTSPQGGVPSCLHAQPNNVKKGLDNFHARQPKCIVLAC